MTTLDFSKFKRAVKTQFDHLTKHDMFRASVGKDEIWQAYFASFPAESNPVFKERTEHDCSCLNPCRPQMCRKPYGVSKPRNFTR